MQKKFNAKKYEATKKKVYGLSQPAQYGKDMEAAYKKKYGQGQPIPPYNKLDRSPRNLYTQKMGIKTTTKSRK